MSTALHTDQTAFQHQSCLFDRGMEDKYVPGENGNIVSHSSCIGYGPHGVRICLFLHVSHWVFLRATNPSAKFERRTGEQTDGNLPMGVHLLREPRLGMALSRCQSNEDYYEPHIHICHLKMSWRLAVQLLWTANKKQCQEELPVMRGPFLLPVKRRLRGPHPNLLNKDAGGEADG